MPPVQKYVRRLAAAACIVLAAMAAAAAQRSGGTAVIAVPGDPGHLNPAITTASPVHAVADSLFNGLVALDREGAPVPDLARSWRASEDGMVYVFTLQDGVRWHDGTPFSSADVKFTFEELLFKFHARTRAGLAPVVEAIETPDAATVVFRLKRPHAALLRQLDVTEAPILPRHLYAGTAPDRHPANLAPVGTGPFRFDSYRKDDSVTLVRNPAYFREGLPYLDRIVFRVIPDPNTTVLALQQGEIDYVGRVGPSDVQRLRGKGITFAESKAGPGGANCVMTLAFNLQRERLADIRVRKAVALALDRQQMVDRILFGQGRVAAAPIASGIAWAHLPDALAAFRTDTTAANALLDSAGLPRAADGRRATLDIAHFPQFARYSELMRQQLAAVGLDLAVRTMDPAAFAQTVFTRRDFDLALVSYCNGADPEIGVRRMYHSANVGTVPFSNAAAYRNPDVDALLERAAGATDLAQRGEAYRILQRQLAADLPYWWLVETDFTSAWRESFRGFAPWTGQFAERAGLAR